jgi:uncharacterized protein with NRDE domain
VCLILAAWRVHPEYPLVVAANRDEFHARPAAPAAFWADQPAILAGRDLEARGTWMGISRGGKFAAVTNYRGGTEPRAAQSRGALVTSFLSGDETAGAYIKSVVPRSAAYSGFNLIASDRAEFWWMSNRDSQPRRLGPGIYGLGNLLLDSPDVEPRKRRFEDALASGAAVEPLFSVLAEARIVNPVYGTRCSTVFFGRRYVERSFAPDGTEQETLHYEL